MFFYALGAPPISQVPVKGLTLYPNPINPIYPNTNSTTLNQMNMRTCTPLWLKKKIN